MTDSEIVNNAYAENVKLLYVTFYNALIIAQDQNAKQQAEQRFTQGITLARQIRDRAIAIIP